MTARDRRDRRREYREDFGPEWVTDAAADIDRALNQMKEPRWSWQDADRVAGLEDATVTITIKSNDQMPPDQENLWTGYIELKRGNEVFYGNTIHGDQFPGLIDSLASHMKAAKKEDSRHNVGPAKRRLTRERKKNSE